jgi:MFS transporter, DHA1 family, tetracycline resistance protein
MGNEENSRGGRAGQSGHEERSGPGRRDGLGVSAELGGETNPLGAEPEFVRAVDAGETTVELPGVSEIPEGRRAAATFIFLTVTLDMLALGMIAPVLPRLITGFMHGNTVNAAQMLGVFGTVFAGIQFLFSPVLGSLSDRFGRRPVVLLSNFGLGMDYLLMAWAPVLGWLFVGRVISGLTASSVPTAMAYMADVTPVEKRASAFGMLGAAFGMGFVLGPAIGGILGSVSPRLPFLVAGSLSMLNGMYGLFVLPESLKKENRSRFSWRRANPVGSVTLLGRKKVLLGMAAVLLLGYTAQQSLMNVYVIYCDYRFHWTDRTVGLSLAVVGICSALYGALLVKHAVRWIGERGAMSVGLICGATGWVMLGVSQTGMLLWLGIPVLNLMSLVWPSAQSIMSREVGVQEQGQLQGAVNSLRGMAGLVGPGLFTYIFSKSIAAGSRWLHAPGIAFFVAAGILLVSLAVAESVRPGRVAAS